MEREERVKLLLLADTGHVPQVERLAQELRRSRHFEVELAPDLGGTPSLDGFDVVYAHLAQGATDEHARALADFIGRGGAFVAAGPTLATLATQRRLAELAAWTPDGRTAPAELVLHSEGGAAPPLRLRESVHLLDRAPEDATPLLTAIWHHTQQVVAYARPCGAGLFVYLGLGHDTALYGDEAFRGMVLRTVAQAARRRVAAREFGVGLLGFGALGAVHAQAIAMQPGLRLAAVCDSSAERRAAAERHGATVVPDATGLLERDDVDVIVVGLPPALHAEHALRALHAGKHVVCEKPFALNAADCDRMIAAAHERDLVLTVFQNRRWDPDFTVLRDAVRSGAVGDVFHLESFVGEYAHPCSYWHSHEPISGGAVFDWGAHHIDWTLQLIDAEVRAVRCVMHKRVWHDVTNADHTTLELSFEGGQHAIFVQSSLAAALKPKWYVLGTSGAITGEWRSETERVRGPDGEIDERRVLPTDLPARVLLHRPAGDGGTHTEQLSLPQRDRGAFYRNLSGCLLHGEPLAVTPAEARRTVAVMEAAMNSARRGGAVIELAL